MSKIMVGQVRPSQLLFTYGPGALIDLPNLSVITMGLDRWDEYRCPPVEEARLLGTVRRALGPQVSRLRVPPAIEEDHIDPFAPESRVGVPVRLFPRWLRCVRCGLLAEYDTGLFEIEEDRFHPDRTHFLHSGCTRGARSDAVPSRFLLACRNGHLDDFPWHWYVHSGPSTCRGTLAFYESGASMQTENLWVKCEACDMAKSLVHAFGREARNHLPACRGRHPHLDTFSAACTEEPRTVLLGATNSWFAITLSALSIPFAGSSLAQIVEDGWEDFKEIDTEEELRATVRLLHRRGILPGIEGHALDDIWQAIQKRRAGEAGGEAVSEREIKSPEWRVLTDANPPSDWPHFLTERVEVPERHSAMVQSVLLVKRLRVVNALVGYTRVEPPEESDDPEERPPLAPLASASPGWVPAGEVHGEGIFLRFREEAVRAWESEVGVGTRDAKIRSGHRAWRNARKLDPENAYPGIRFAMLHTLSHLLIRELAMECGYEAASIRERVYATSGGDGPMAGILLYTAANDSEGTLGGLIEMGKPVNLARIIDQALRRAAICSSDPLCSEHDPEKDRSLHGAACHACTFVAETSCERMNRYLDRALLVDTYASRDAALFGGHA